VYVADGELSPDGHFLAWESIGGIRMSMTTDVYLGLAVTSHSPGTLATAVFDDVIVQR
jgi:hypothetical protein